VRLKYRSATELGSVLQQMFAANAKESTTRIVSEPTANLLLIAASADQLARINAIIVQLDKPQSEPKAVDLRQLRVFQLRTIKPDKPLLDAVGLLMPGGTGRMSVQAARDQLIVYADEKSLAKVEAL